MKSSEGKGIKIDWNKKYNDLPYDVRVIGSVISCKLRIQHLNFEKDRLKKRYIQSIKEINLHIKNCENNLIDLEKHYEPKITR